MHPSILILSLNSPFVVVVRKLCKNDVTKCNAMQSLSVHDSSHPMITTAAPFSTYSYKNSFRSFLLSHRRIIYTSNPSASHRSVKTSIICGSGTFLGNRGGSNGSFPREAPPPLQRGSKSTSIIPSTSTGMACL